jgi:hypothetical protein
MPAEGGGRKRSRAEADSEEANIFLPSPAQVRKQRAKEIAVYQRTQITDKQPYGDGLAKQSLVKRFKVVKQRTADVPTLGQKVRSASHIN